MNKHSVEPSWAVFEKAVTTASLLVSLALLLPACAGAPMATAVPTLEEETATATVVSTPTDEVAIAKATVEAAKAMADARATQAAAQAAIAAAGSPAPPSSPPSTSAPTLTPRPTQTPTATAAEEPQRPDPTTPEEGEWTLEWKSPVNVSDSPAGASWYPSAAMDGHGGIHVVWSEWPEMSSSQDGSQREVLYSQWNTDTGSWSLPLDVSGIGGDSGKPYSAIAIGPDDRVLVVWVQDVSQFETQLAFRFGQGGSWGPLAFVPDAKGYAPSLAFTADGEAHLAWACNYEGTQGVCYSKWDGQEWTTPLLVPGGERGRFPQLKADLNGGLHLAWIGLGDQLGVSRVMYSRLSQGQSWAEPLEAVYREEQSRRIDAISMAVDSAGQAHLAWWVYYSSDRQSGEEALPCEVWHVRVTAGEQVVPQLVATMPGLHTRSLNLYLDDVGGVHALWFAGEALCHAGLQDQLGWSQPRCVAWPLSRCKSTDIVALSGTDYMVLTECMIDETDPGDVYAVELRLQR